MQREMSLIHRECKAILPVYSARTRLTQIDWVMFCIMQSRTADWGSNKFLFSNQFFACFYCGLKNNIEENEDKSLKYG